MDVRERFQQAESGFPSPPPRDPREVFRRGRRRRHRRISALGGGTALATMLAVVIGVEFGPEQQLPEIVNQPDATAPGEQAPVAGAVDAHWPIELVYQRPGGRHERFRGNSWRDWSLEVRTAGEFQLVDREHPSVAFDTEGGEFSDRDLDMEDFTRAPGPHLIGDWRNTTGLIDRSVVPIEQIPGGPELIDEIGLSADQVEGYITPNITGCSEPLAACIPEGQAGARGIAHLPTGFPLYAEEARSGERSNVWIEAISIRWADADIEPVPIDTAQPDDAAAEVEIEPLDISTPVALRLLAGRFNDPSLAVIDLEAGELRRIRAGTRGLSRDALGGGLILADGTVVIWQNDTVRAFTADLSSATLEYVPETLLNPPGTAPSLRVLPSPNGDALWVVQVGSCCPDASDGRAELVDLATGEVLDMVDLPPRTFPAATTPDGLLLNTERFVETSEGFVDEPGSQRTLLLSGDGTLTELVPGRAVGVSGNDALIEVCDQQPESGCELDLIDIQTGERRRLERPVPGTWATASGPAVPGEHTPWSTTAPDGRILATINVHDEGGQQPSESHLVIIDPEQPSTTIAASFDGPTPPAAWDRQGRHIVLIDRQNVTILDPTADTTSVLPDLVPDNHHGIAIG